MNRLSVLALRSFSGVGPVDPWSPETALLIIDMQNRLVRPDGFTSRRLRERGLEEADRQYQAQMRVAIMNMGRLLDRARREAVTIVHVRTTPIPGASGFAVTGKPTVEDLAIIEELTPAPGELVIEKACSGAFAGTNIDYMLRRLGARSIVVTGCVTDGCVEQAIRQGHDLGYGTVLVSDATAALTDEVHANALQRLEHRRAHVLSTETLLTEHHITATTIEVPARF